MSAPALGDIIRAKGTTEIAESADLGRANLYKALSPKGNPEFDGGTGAEGAEVEIVGPLSAHR